MDASLTRVGVKPEMPLVPALLIGLVIYILVRGWLKRRMVFLGRGAGASP